jgi:hypothetical protein
MDILFPHFQDSSSRRESDDGLNEVEPQSPIPVSSRSSSTSTDDRREHPEEVIILNLFKCMKVLKVIFLKKFVALLERVKIVKRVFTYRNQFL